MEKYSRQAYYWSNKPLKIDLDRCVKCPAYDLEIASVRKEEALFPLEWDWSKVCCQEFSWPSPSAVSHLFPILRPRLPPPVLIECENSDFGFHEESSRVIWYTLSEVTMRNDNVWAHPFHRSILISRNWQRSWCVFRELQEISRVSFRVEALFVGGFQ